MVDTNTGAHEFDLRVVDVGGDEPWLIGRDVRRRLETKISVTAAIDTMLGELRTRWAELGRIDAVVHRVVHGGEEFSGPTLIEGDVLARLAKLEDLAPLHNPPAIHAIRGARELFANTPQLAIFDTAFHVTLPRRAREYALPEEVRTRLGIRRHGFHGISHGDVATRTAAFLRKKAEDLRVISCHLGSGASITAIEQGRSVETSMGMTPLEGLIMGTRAGDLDPGAMIELSRHFSADGLESLLTKESGLLGLAGTSDMREIERRAAEGDERCRLAIDAFAHRIRKYLGAYAAVMGGVDVIAFTGGIGEHSALVRNRCLQRLGFLDAIVDENRNRDARVDSRHPVVDIARDDSRVRILILLADEERAMSAEASRFLAGASRPASTMRIPIAVSARHAHLSQATLEQLFGAGFQLRPRTALSQTGQFAAQETVRLIGPRGSVEHVRLVGPPRERDQVEISRSDEFVLGLDAPVRMSGDLADTPGVTLEGSQGRVRLTGGVICARRHLHMPPREAQLLGICDRDNVSVRVDSEGRDLVFEDVRVRVSPQFSLELHLDTDEANAAGVSTGDFAELVGRVPGAG